MYVYINVSEQTNVNVREALTPVSYIHVYHVTYMFNV